jgi:hypothetical protein
VNSFRAYKPRPAYTTAGVVTSLMDQVGGIKKAAFLIGKSESQALAYSDPATDSQISYDNVRRLVVASGATAPADDLAALAGGFFNRCEIDPRSFADLVALGADEWGAFLSKVIRGMTDGTIDQTERRVFLEGLDVLIRALVSARSKVIGGAA